MTSGKVSRRIAALTMFQFLPIIIAVYRSQLLSKSAPALILHANDPFPTKGVSFISGSRGPPSLGIVRPNK